MMIALKVSVRSLWVDCLCIIEDSEQDEARDISHMEEILSECFLDQLRNGCSVCFQWFSWSQVL